MGASFNEAEYDLNNNVEYKFERPSSTSKTNIYIRGLDEDTTDKDLFDMCQKLVLLLLQHAYFSNFE